MWICLTAQKRGHRVVSVGLDFPFRGEANAVEAVELQLYMM